MYGPDLPLPDLIRLPQKWHTTFEGFGAKSFELLQRLKDHPHIDQYRKDKALIRRHIQEPFHVFRDDLVVNWVLPNQLPFETERNVFSRLLKNDFGAGGCHHHLWLSFYRPGLRRLSDAQLAHSISPDGFASGLYVGDHAPALLRAALDNIARNPDGFIQGANRLLGEADWIFRIWPRGTKRTEYENFTARLSTLPDSLFKARGIWLRKMHGRDAILNGEIDLVRSSIEALQKLWPLYLFLLGNRDSNA